MITQLVRSRPGDPSPHALTGDMGGHVRSAGLGNVKEGLEESTGASFDKQKSPLWTVAVVITRERTARPPARQRPWPAAAGFAFLEPSGLLRLICSLPLRVT